jgi:putative membrane protein
MNKENQIPDPIRTRNLLASERTFLAWIRTSLGIMAFGFVVEKFALFIKQIAVVFPKQNTSEITPTTTSGNASYFGILLIGFGAILGLCAYLKHRQTKKQIEHGVYRSSLTLARILTIAIVAIGAFLIYYLIN